MKVELLCMWFSYSNMWVCDGSSVLLLFVAVLGREEVGWPRLQLAVNMRSLRSLMEYQSTR